MPYHQDLLPGMDQWVFEDKPSPIMMIYIAHVSLRSVVGELFDHEIGVMRIMGRMNDAQCPDKWFVAERNICDAVVGLAKAIDALNDAMEGEFHAE